MDVPKSILSSLICSKCESYLKRSPIYLKHDGTAVCGSCLDPNEKDKATRNKQYEILAQIAKFPCKYQEFGCTKTIVFGNENAHTLICPFKQFLCPVSESGQCDWLGIKKHLLEHCEIIHPGSVIKNPLVLTHNITRPSTNTYIINAFENVLFILHTRVDVKQNKIYHCVRYFGQQGHVYTYSLKVKRNELEITKPGKVAPEGCLALQEDASLVLSINSLLEILDGFDNTTFFLSIKRPCKFQCKGCKYVDIPWKCLKHEKFFCNYSTKCVFCKNSHIDTTLIDHYHARHNEYVRNGGSKWMPKGLAYKNDDKISAEVCFITSEVGTLICEWFSSEKMSWFVKCKIYAPTAHDFLINYECSMVETLSSIAPKYKLASCVLDNDVEDWFFYMEKKPEYMENSEMCIRINRIHN